MVVIIVVVLDVVLVDRSLVGFLVVIIVVIVVFVGTPLKAQWLALAISMVLCLRIVGAACSQAMLEPFCDVMLPSCSTLFQLF